MVKAAATFRDGTVAISYLAVHAVTECSTGSQRTSWRPLRRLKGRSADLQQTACSEYLSLKANTLTLCL